MSEFPAQYNLHSRGSFDHCVLLFIKTLLLTRGFFVFVAGLVPEQESQVAQDGEVLGQKYNNGRIWTLWSHGPALLATAGHYPEERQRKRMRCPLATW